MASTYRYYLSSATGSAFQELDLSWGYLATRGEDLVYVGTAAVDALFVHSGLVFDLSASTAGVDKLYFSGTFDAYTKTLVGDNLILTRTTEGDHIETVILNSSGSLALSHNLVFSNGSVRVFDLYAELTGALAPHPSGETSANPSVAGSLSPMVKAFSQTSEGDLFDMSKPGVTLIVHGGAGVDVVYVSAGAVVDAHQLGGAADEIHFLGAWADYSKSVDGSNLTFSRTVGADTETVTVSAGLGPSNDWIIFSDGAVRTNAARGALSADLHVSLENVPGVTQAALIASAVSEPSILIADSQTVLEDNVAQGNVLSNDSDVDNVLLVTGYSVSGVDYAAGAQALLPGVGRFTLEADGSYVFAPLLNYNGVVPEVTYTTNTSSTSTLNISVTPVDDPSVLTPDTQMVYEDNAARGNVLRNDLDVDSVLSVASFMVAGDPHMYSAGKATTVRGVTVYSTGQTATIAGVGQLLMNSDGSYTFTPVANYNGSVPQVTYTTNTGVSSTLDIYLTPVDDPSVLVADSKTVLEDYVARGNVLANDSDVDNVLTVSTYAVAGDSHVYTAGKTTTIGGVTVFSTGQAATIAGVGKLVLNSDGSYQFTPEANYNGSVPEVTYTTNTGFRSTLNISVTPVDDPSVLVADSKTVLEDNVARGNVLANDSDVDNVLMVSSFMVAGDSHVYNAGRTTTIGGVTVYSNGQTATIAGVGKLVMNGDGSYVFTPFANYNGAVPEVTYTTNTGFSSTLNISVTPVDDPSVLVADTQTVLEDNVARGNVLTNDSDVDNALMVSSFLVAGDSHVYNAGRTTTIGGVTVYSNGETATIAGVGKMVMNGDGSYTFTPEANYNGAVPEVTYTTNTGFSSSLNISVTPVDDPSVLVADTQTVLEDNVARGNVLTNDSDVDNVLMVSTFTVAGDAHVYNAGRTTTIGGVTVYSNGQTAAITGVGKLVMNGDGSYVFTPDLNFNGSVPRVTYTINTGSTSTLDINMTPVNDPPVAHNDVAVVDQDTVLTLLPAALLANDTDVENDTLSIQSVQGATHGSVSLNANGSMLFTPTPGYSGPASFTYTASDGHGGTSTATVDVTVNHTAVAINHAPSFLTPDGIAPWPSQLLFGDLAVRSNGQMWVGGTSISGGPQFGLARLNANGTLDTGFANGGVVTTNLRGGWLDGVAERVFELNGGKILLAGSAYSTAGTDQPGGFALARYNSDGSLDTSFNLTGKVVSDFDQNISAIYYGTQRFNYEYSLNDAAVQPDGKVVAVGYGHLVGAWYQANHMVVARYNVDGTLDTSFDGDGVLTTSFGPGSDGGSSWDFANSVAVQSDGKIVVSGSTGAGQYNSNYNSFVARYLSNGQLDPSFGDDGKVVTDFAAGQADTTDRITTELVQTDGKIVVAGFSGQPPSNWSPSTDTPFLARYNTDGSLDTSFGNSGMAAELKRVVGGVSHTENVAIEAAALQPDGKILVTGWAYDAATTQSYAILARYNSSGTLDTSFDQDGVAFAGGAGVASSLSEHMTITVMPNGKILLSAQTLERFNSDGSLDTSFGPLVDTLNNHSIYVTGTAPVVLDSSVSVSDQELDTLGHYAGATLTLARQLGPNAEDVFSGSGNLELIGGQVLWSHEQIGTFSESAGSLVIMFNSAATQAKVNSALSSLAYTTTSTASHSHDVSVEWTFSDGNSGAQGGGPALTAVGHTVVTVIHPNDAPAGSNAAVLVIGDAYTLTLADFGFSDVNGDNFNEVVISTLPASGSLTLNGSPVNVGSTVSSWDIDGGSLVFTPAADAVGKNSYASFQFQVRDDGGTSYGGVNTDPTPNAITIDVGNHAPTFAIGDGKTLTSFYDSQPAYAGRSALQSDGKFLIAGTAHHTVTDYWSEMALARYNADGTLDTSFGGDGTVSHNFTGHGFNVGNAVAVQPDGKIVEVGWGESQGRDFLIARYNPDGTVDGSFGANGAVVYHDPGYQDWDSLNSVNIDPNGNIVVAGDLATGDVAVMRFNSQGALDTNFNSTGRAVLDIHRYDSTSTSVIQPDGKTLLGGSTNVNSPNSAYIDDGLMLARYDSQGHLDPAFGVGGKVVTDFNQIWSGEYSASMGEMTLQADGKILVTGTVVNRYSYYGGLSESDMVLLRYLPDGTLDTSFGEGGVSVLDQIPNAGITERGASVTVQVDGKIVVAGYSEDVDGNRGFAVFRVNSKGQLDSTFDGDGMLITGFDPASGITYSAASDVLIEPDGRIVVVGNADNPATGYNDFAVARFNIDGSLANSTLDNSPAYAPCDAPVALDDTVRIFDKDLAALNGGQGNYSGASVTLNRHGGANSHDAFSAVDGSALTIAQDAGHLSALVNGVNIGAVSNEGGSLTIAFNTLATQALVNQALSSLAYSNNSPALAGALSIDWTFNDGNAGAQGRGNSMTTVGHTDIQVLPWVNHAPVGLDKTISVEEDTAYIFSLSDFAISDADSNALAAVHFAGATLASMSGLQLDGVQVGANTTVTVGQIAGGHLVYIPALNSNGTGLDHLGFQVQDNGGTDNGGQDTDPSQRTLTVDVKAVNDAPTFVIGGQDGLVTTDFGGTDLAYCVASQPDGKTIVAGYSLGLGGALALARYNPDGGLDAGFGLGGKVAMALSTSFASINDVALQPDGKIIIVGGADAGVGLVIARLNSDGSLDTSFGDSGTGIINADFTGQASANGLLIQADDKLVVVALVLDSSSGLLDAALIRVDTLGHRDVNFAGGSGVVSINHGVGNEFANAVLASHDPSQLGSDKLIVETSNANGVVLTRFDSDGGLDLSFGSSGTGAVFVPVQVSSVSAAKTALFDASGRILVAGSADVNGHNHAVLMRYTSDGALDTSFHGTGSTSVESDYSTRGMALQADGKVLLVGGDRGYFNLERFNVDGSLDTSFNGTGTLTAHLGIDGSAFAVAVQPNGQILVTGSLQQEGSGSSDMALARFNSDGSLDTTFDAVHTLDSSPTFYMHGPAVVLDSSVQIFDAELSAQNNFDGATVTLQRHGVADAHDHFSAPSGGKASFSQGSVVWQGQTIGTESEGAGSLVIHFNGSATQEAVNDTLSSIAYANDATTPPISVVIDWAFNDANFAAAQGSGGAKVGWGSTTVTVSPPANHLPTFAAGSGQAIADVGGGRGLTSAVQTDGKVLVAGFAFNGMADVDFAVVRYNLDGSLDTGFGVGGRSVVTVSAFDDEVKSIAVQPDGGILLAGYAGDPESYNGVDFALVRLKSDGNLDTGFGDGGVVTTNLTTDFTGWDSWDEPNSVQVLSDGHILVTGRGGSALDGAGNWYSPIVQARYTSSGILDEAFGNPLTTPGLVYKSPSISGSNDHYADHATGAMPDGKVLMAGWVWNPATGTDDLSIWRFGADGSPDPNFGVDGWASLDLAGHDLDTKTMSVGPDGKIVVAGRFYGVQDHSLFVARFNSNGELDTSFVGDASDGVQAGLIAHSLGGDYLNVRGSAVQADGKILIVGDVEPLGHDSMVLIRYNVDGSLDTHFGSLGTGWVVTDIGIAGTVVSDAYDVKVLPNGVISVSGWSGVGNMPSVFAQVQFNPDGSPNIAFGSALNSLDGAPVYNLGGPAVVLDGTVQVYDADLAALDGNGNYANSTISIARHGTPLATDHFSGSGGLSFSNQDVVLDGVSVGSLLSSAGTLSIVFNNQATQARVNKVLSSIAFASTDTSQAGPVQMDWTFNDGNTGTQGVGGNGQGTGSITLHLNHAPQGRIVLNGSPNVGQTLSLDVSGVSDTDGLGGMYSTWQSSADGINWTLVNGNNNAFDTLPLTQDLLGQQIRVIVGYTDGNSIQEFVTSPTTNPIGPPALNQGPAFGVGSRTDIPGTVLSESSGLLVQADGKIVQVGYADPSWSSAENVMVRYNSDGSLDTTFGASGVVQDYITASYTYTKAIAETADHKLLVGAESYSYGQGFLLARYNQDGSLDTTFHDATGFSATNVLTSTSSAHAMVVQADGKVVLVGSSAVWDAAASIWRDNAALARFNEDGSLDTSFSGDGLLLTNVYQYAGSHDNAVAVQTNGKIVVVGGTDDGTHNQFTITRYNTDGSLDTGFAGTGYLTAPDGLTQYANTMGYRVSVQTDGKILMLGEGASGYFATLPVTSNAWNSFLVRYNTDGTLDTSFSGDGLEYTRGTGSFQAYNMLLQPDGKILVVGSDPIGYHSGVSVMRLNTDGSLDPSFGANGTRTIDMGASEFTQEGLNLAVDATGRLVISGQLVDDPLGNGSYQYKYFSLRLDGEGNWDRSYGMSTLDASPIYVAGHSAVVMDGSVAVYDPELSVADNYSGATLTVSRHGGALPNDVFSASGDVSLSGGTLQVLGAIVGTYAESQGQLIISFNGNATQDLVNRALSSLTYANSGSLPESTVQVDWTFNDGNVNQQGAGGAKQITNTVTIQVDHAPLLSADALTLPMGSASVIAGSSLLSNDHDPDGDTLTLTGVQDAIHGSVSLQPDGSISFTPEAGYVGPAQFSYSVSDGRGASTSASVQLTIAPTSPTFFDGKGISLTGFSGHDAIATGGLMQPDGKVVVVGGEPRTSLYVARYNTDGSLDASFGPNHDGRFVAPGYASNVTLQPNGQLLVYRMDAQASYLLNTDGTLAGTLPVSSPLGAVIGLPSVLPADTGYWASSYLVESDGSILVAGSQEAGLNGPQPDYGNFALAHYSAAGVLDTAFGNQGSATVDFLTGRDAATSLAMKPNGDIVLAGWASVGFSGQSALAVFDSTGHLNANVNTGVSESLLPGELLLTRQAGAAASVYVQPDGKTVVSGEVLGSDGFFQFYVTRFNADWTIDKSFNVQPGLSWDNVLLKSTAYYVNSAPKVLDSSAQIYDPALHALDNYAGSSITVSRDAPNSNDVFTGSGDLNLHGGQAWLSGVNVGSVTSQAGQLTITFNAQATQAAVNQVLSSIAYSSTEDPYPNFDPTTPVPSQGNPGDPRVMNWTFNESPAGPSTTESTRIEARDNWLFDGNEHVTASATAVTTGNVMTNTLDWTGSANTHVSTFSIAGDANGSVHQAGDSVTLAGVGVFVMNADGSYSFTPQGVNHGAIPEVTYVVADDYPTSNVSTLTFNSAPVAVNDSVVTPGAALLLPSTFLLANDFDADGNGLTVQGVQGASHGSVQLAANGDVTFTPDVGYSGQAGFTYTVSDGARGTSTATVNVTVGTPSPNTSPSFFAIGGGVSRVDLGNYDIVRDALVQSDGKIVEVGLSNNQFAVARFNSNGQLDSTFNHTGIQLTDVSIKGDDPWAVLQQSDHKIVVAGQGGDASWNERFALVRYNPDGSPDTTFGALHDGKTVSGEFVGTATGMAELANGDLAVIGRMSALGGSSLGTDIGIAVYNPQGVLDSSFAGTGWETTSFGGPGYFTYGQGNPIDVIALPGGKVLVAGSVDYYYGSYSSAFALARYNADGSLDSSFNAGGASYVAGTVATRLHEYGWNDQIIDAITVLSNSEVLAAGNDSTWNGTTGTMRLALAIYKTDGRLDTSFGNGSGFVIVDHFGVYTITGSDGRAVEQADGHILVPVTASDANGVEGVGVLRFDRQGNIDSNYNGTGFVFNGSVGSYPYSLIQPDGSIVVAGSDQTSDSDFSLALLDSHGNLNQSFGNLSIDTVNATPVYRGVPAVLDSTVQVTDAELDARGNYSGATVTLHRDGVPDPHDAFSGVGSLSLMDGIVSLSNLNVGTVLVDSGGTLTLGFNSNATQVRVNQVLSSLAYANDSATPPSQVQVDWSFNDGNVNGGQVPGGVKSTQGVTTVSFVNDAPPTFGVDGGKSLASFYSQQDAIGSGAALQADGKVVVVGTAYHTMTDYWSEVALARFNVDGTLDTTFGGDGTVSNNFTGYSFDVGNALAIQGDGKIIAVGWGTVGGSSGNRDFLVARYNSDGSVDQSFGTHGAVSYSDPGYSSLNSVNIETDGKIVAVGETASGDIAVLRFNANGTPDSQFNGSGRVVTDIARYDSAMSSVIQPNGAIIVGGAANGYSQYSGFALERYTPSGSLDTSFNGTGKVTTNFTALWGGTFSGSVSGLAVQPDGKILAVGSVTDLNTNDYGYGYGMSDIVVARYNTNGSLDTNFGLQGVQFFDLDGTYQFNDVGNSITVQSDGKIVLAGSSVDANGATGFAAVRLDSSGQLDPSFGSGGQLITAFGSSRYSFSKASAIMVRPDGQLVLAGTTNESGSGDKAFAMLRLNSDGSPNANTLDQTPGYVPGSTPVCLDGYVQVSDAELAALNAGLGNYSGASVTLARHGGPDAHDLFSALTGSHLSFTNNNGQGDGDALLSGSTIGSVSNHGGVLSIHFGVGATQAAVNEALSSIAYANDSSELPATAQIDWTFNDGNIAAAQGAGGAQSTVGHITVTIGSYFGTSGDDLVLMGNLTQAHQSYFGQSGNDTFAVNGVDGLNSAGMVVDGGVGVDTLRFDSSADLTLDFSNVGHATLQNMEVIDLTGQAHSVSDPTTANNTLNLTLNELLSAGTTGQGIHVLRVDGDQGDTVNLSGLAPVNPTVGTVYQVWAGSNQPSVTVAADNSSSSHDADVQNEVSLNGHYYNAWYGAVGGQSMLLLTDVLISAHIT